MNVNTFLALLLSFSVISSLVTEGIKEMLSDKENISYNIMALIVSIIIGGCGTLLFFYFKDVVFAVGHVIYAILMGLATGLCSMVGYDKVKQTVTQLFSSDTESDTVE